MTSGSLGVMARGLILGIPLDSRPIYYNFGTQQYHIGALPNILEINGLNNQTNKLATGESNRVGVLLCIRQLRKASLIR